MTILPVIRSIDYGNSNTTNSFINQVNPICILSNSIKTIPTFVEAKILLSEVAHIIENLISSINNIQKARQYKPKNIKSIFRM